MPKLVWFIGLMKDLGVQLYLLVCIHSNSKSTIQIIVNPIFYERTKCIEVDCHFIREKIQGVLVKTKYIPAKEQPADLITKRLNKTQHNVLMSKLGIINLFAPPSLKGIVG